MKLTWIPPGGVLTVMPIESAIADYAVVDYSIVDTDLPSPSAIPIIEFSKDNEFFRLLKKYDGLSAAPVTQPHTDRPVSARADAHRYTL